MIKVNDFVVLTEEYKGIDKNSVGFVEELASSNAKVFIGKNVLIDIDLSKSSL